MKKKIMETLSITERECTAMLKLLIPGSRLTALEDSEEKIVESMLEELMGEKDLHAFVTRKRGKDLKRKLSVGPMEKAVLLRKIDGELGIPNLKTWYRKELQDIDRKLKKLKHPLTT